MTEQIILEATTETWRIEELEPINIEDDDDDNEGDGGEDEGDDDEGDGGEPTEGTEEDIDKAHKSVEEKMSGAKDLGKDEIDDADKENQGKGNKRGSPSQGTQGKNPDPTEFDYKSVRPTYSWEQLLRKLVSDVTNQTEDTYQRVNRRNITGMETARQTGFGVVKPGEIELDNKIKLCFVVDSSGSMSGDIAKVYSNMMHLLKQHRQALNADFILIKFSNDYVIYHANFAKGNYVVVNGVDEKKSGKMGGSLEELFSQHFGSSTNFSKALCDDIVKLASKKYNVILLTDTDINAPDNAANFIDAYVKAKQQLYILAADHNNYVSILKTLGQASRNITYIN
jgi:hypothetical protein